MSRHTTVRADGRPQRCVVSDLYSGGPPALTFVARLMEEVGGDGMFGKSSPPDRLSQVERTILENMHNYEWRSPLMMTVYGIPLEESTQAMEGLVARGLLSPDTKGEFSSAYDPSPKFQITSRGRKALRS